MSSDDAVSSLPEELDFVYVDGNHAGRQVERDLSNYWPKIRPGGVIGGHDWKLPDFEGLVNAVIRFSVEKNLVLHGELMDYWFINEEK